MFGGSGKNAIYADNGGNHISGGTGVNVVHGSSGSNWLYGAAGNNTITGGSGHEIIHGGGGTNNLSVDSSAGGSDIFGGPAGSTNNIQGGPGNDIVYNGPGTMQSLDGGGALDNREIQSYGGSSDPDANWTYDPAAPGAPVYIDLPFSFPGESGERLSGETVQYAVFVRWEPNASLTHKLWFTVNSVDTAGYPISNTIMVDETQAVPFDNASYEPNDVSWLRLGHSQNGGTEDPTLWPTFIGTATGGISVEITSYDPANPTDKIDGPAYIGAIMVRPLWPTVSIHAEAPVPGEAAANADDYRDWLGSSQPTDIPLEAPGVQRVAFDLHASIENIYHTPDELYAVLPDVAGLEFWTAETGGTQLFPDINGNIIDQPLSSGGVYNGTVYVSVDPDGPLATGSDATVAITEEVQSGGSEVVECQAGAAVQAVQTADIIRTSVDPPAGQPNNTLAKRFKFSLTHSLPYDVVIVQKVSFRATATFQKATGTHAYTSNYFEIIGVVRHGQTQIQGGQGFNDTWLDPGNVNMRSSPTHVDMTMQGQVRAFVAAPSPPLGEKLPKWLPIQTAQEQVPAQLIRAQDNAAAVLKSFHGPQVWFQGANMITDFQDVNKNTPWVTSGTYAASEGFTGSVWNTDWVGVETTTTGANAGKAKFHEEKISGPRNSPTSKPRDVFPNPNSVWATGKQEWL